MSQDFDASEREDLDRFEDVTDYLDTVGLDDLELVATKLRAMAAAVGDGQPMLSVALKELAREVEWVSGTAEALVRRDLLPYPQPAEEGGGR